MSDRSEATENYLKAVYQLTPRGEKVAVSSGEIAKRVGVAPATATLMLQKLAENGLVRYEAYSGVTLTKKGKLVALNMLRRHRLIELFLVQTLGMPWDEVHAEAERLEHSVSDALVDRMDEFLGRPAVDPHGSPIPRHDGSLPESETFVSLDKCSSNTSFVVRHVPDQTPEFLRYLSDVGLGVGAAGFIEANCTQSGILNIIVDDKPIALSRESARSVHVVIVG